MRFRLRLNRSFHRKQEPFPLDGKTMSCYDACVMQYKVARPDRFYFYFYFSAATQPRNLRMGQSASVLKA